MPGGAVSSEPGSDPSTLGAQLRELAGVPGGRLMARDPVNAPAIRTWCDAMGDGNPVYVDPATAAASVHGGIVAPPTMLNAWTMPGNVPRPVDPDDAYTGVLRTLDAHGFTSVVASNSEHEYVRYLRPGDLLTQTTVLEDVSDEKHTALGVGHFVTNRTDYVDESGEVVGRMRFRVLKFRPGTGRAEAAAVEAPPPRPRPRPGVSPDTEFFWDGLRAGELRIQRSVSSGTLFHPPMVRDPATGSMQFDHVVASGRGTVYSFTVQRYPTAPGFAGPAISALVELEEGPRLISTLSAVEPDAVHVGMPVEVVFDEVEPGYVLHAFRPRRPPRRETTLRFGDVAVGDGLAPCPIPITATQIVAGALASRDFQDVHHDRDLAHARGSQDIFMNILTSSGLCGRYVSDWAGPEAVFRSLRIRLGAPNHPHDTMTMYGSVTAATAEGAGGVVEVSLRGANSLGDHVVGTAEIALPA
jgi:uncharacterized protein